MRYGKIRVEDGNLVFFRHMIQNNLPCRDIIWAYIHREGESTETAVKQMISNYLVIITRRKKRYQFEMTEHEAQDCLRILKLFNPEMATGFPKGGKIALESLPNTRDLGAIATKDGRHVLPRKLLRSGNLYHASMADQRVLQEECKLKTVIDLRDHTERKERPDIVLKGVEYYHIPMIDEETISDSPESVLGMLQANGMLQQVLAYDGDIEELIRIQYENFVKDQYSVKQCARFMDVLLHHENGAVLWHCSFGKDRVGVTTALLLCALGVHRDEIREDFMRSNVCLVGELDYMLRYLEANRLDSIANVNKVSALFKVKEEYLDRMFRVIYTEYGNVDRFLRRGLYLNPKTVTDLQGKYLI
ncbi:tyrosine-protein phosphatase [Blautia sp. HCP3S3_H10_1]|uniref:tyrosine-protein phosphatase n=1 Tax=unclassified Blautia TaxID=2648079 RepID=UPI003F8E7E06